MRKPGNAKNHQRQCQNENWQEAAINFDLFDDARYDIATDETDHPADHHFLEEAARNIEDQWQRLNGSAERQNLDQRQG